MITKRFISSVVMAVAVLIAVPAVLVSAQEDTTTQDTAQTADVTAAQRQTRIDEIKARTAERVTDAEATRIQGVCSAAQTVVERLQTNLDTVIANRRTGYNSITEKLQAIMTRLASTDVDTTQLSTAITDAETQITALISSVQSYQTTLSDLAAMDCQADPTGFRAVLAEARTQRASIVTESQALKTFITENVRTTLQQIKDQLTAGIITKDEA